MKFNIATITTYFKKITLQKKFLIINFFISFLLLNITPLLSIVWMSFISLFIYLYGERHYGTFVMIWVPTIFAWSIVISISLSEFAPLYVGGQYTPITLGLITGKKVYFESLCIQTVVYLDAYSILVGHPVKVPMIFVPFSFFGNPPSRT